MNTAQIIRLALFMADAVNQDGTTDPFYQQAELLAMCNDAKDKVEMGLRQAKEDFQLITMQSDDDTFEWGHISFAPTTLQLNSTTKRYKLPPDLITLKSIRCIESGYEWVQFRQVDMSSEEFKVGQSFSVDNTSDAEILYDIVGENNLVLAYAPTSTLDIEISYIARSHPLQMYTTGTVTLVNGSASVSGGSTLWTSNGVVTNCDLIVSVDETAPKIVGTTSTGTWVDPSLRYYPVYTIDSDGGLTLSAPWPLTGVAGKGYMLASTPVVPAEHHMQIVDLLVARMKLKDKNSGPDTFVKSADTGARLMTKDLSARNLDRVPTVDDWIANER